MSVVKKYFKDETKWEMLGLDHPKPADFYLSSWQNTRSSVPLLIFRVFLFLSALAIVLTSVFFYILCGISLQFWLIYLTHWGILLILLSTFFSVIVSAKVYFSGPVSTEFSLPWYVKTYWVLYNIANPISFLITVFYWSVLYKDVSEEANLALDVATHGLNTVIMFLLLMSSGHPSRLLHIHHPVMFGLGWTFFSVIYYLAGGMNPKGDRYIYPVLDWSRPGSAIAIVGMTAVLLICLHLLVLGLATLREFIASQLCRAGVTHHIEEGTPLRQTNNVNQ